jgi:hypothetical protein
LRQRFLVLITSLFQNASDQHNLCPELWPKSVSLPRRFIVKNKFSFFICAIAASILNMSCVNAPPIDPIKPASGVAQESKRKMMAGLWLAALLS